MASLTAVILTHNKSAYTRAALESLMPTRGVGFEVVVVDNGSTDDTPQMLDELRPRFDAAGARLRWRLNGRNVGCSTARNLGVGMAEGEFVAFLDNDVMAPDPDWAQRLIGTLQAEPGAVIVGPKMVYPFPPYRVQCAGVGISPNGRVQFRGRGAERGEPEFNKRCDVQCLISACFVFRRSLYGEIGGLDEAFNPIEFEDFDFCYRARAAGGRCVYEPGVEMQHWESITSEGTAALPNTYLIIKNGMLFKKRWRHMFTAENGPADDECRWEPITMPSLDGERTR